MKRRMKKIVALLSVAALAVSLATGCGSGSDSSSDSGSKKTSSAKGANSTEMTSEEIIKQAETGDLEMSMRLRPFWKNMDSRQII